jgi:hypothetical protein
MAAQYNSETRTRVAQINTRQSNRARSAFGGCLCASHLKRNGFRRLLLNRQEGVAKSIKFQSKFVKLERFIQKCLRVPVCVAKCVRHAHSNVHHAMHSNSRHIPNPDR